MSIITEIRESTGLSHAQLAAWLGVSKSLIRYAETGERSLPSAASQKLNAITLLLLQIKKDVTKVKRHGETVITNPAKLAERHKRKMEFHGRSALALQIQLRKLKTKYPQLDARLALFDAMRNTDLEWYRASASDTYWMEMVEWLSKERIPLTGLEQQELLQDKIEMHLAYAELHKQRWEKFSKMFFVPGLLKPGK